MNPKEKISEHYIYNDFMCHCGCGKIIIEKNVLDFIEKFRTKINYPVYLNCITRCEKYNMTVGGVANSEHLQGLGIDIQAYTSEYKFQLIQFAIENGIKRIGIYENFMHIGLSTTHPQNVLWRK